MIECNQQPAPCRRDELSAWTASFVVPLVWITVSGLANAPLVYLLLALGVYTTVLIFAGPRLSPGMWAAIGHNNLMAFAVMLGKIAGLIGTSAWVLNGDARWQMNGLIVATLINLMARRGEYRDTIETSVFRDC